MTVDEIKEQFDIVPLRAQEIELLVSENLAMIYKELIKNKVCHMSVYVDNDGLTKLAIGLQKV